MNKLEIKKIKLLNTEYVYCLSNKSFSPNILKVGWTRHNPTHRANQLYTTGLPTPFKIEFLILTHDGNSLEKRIHDYLKRYRVNWSREFFNISLAELREILTKKFSLSLIQLSDIIDHLPKEEQLRKPKNQISEQIGANSSSNSEYTPSLINSEELNNMFAAFRYEPSPPNTPREVLNLFDKFKYRPSSS